MSWERVKSNVMGPLPDAAEAKTSHNEQNRCHSQIIYGDYYSYILDHILSMEVCELAGDLIYLCHELP